MDSKLILKLQKQFIHSAMISFLMVTLGIGLLINVGQITANRFQVRQTLLNIIDSYSRGGAMDTPTDEVYVFNPFTLRKLINVEYFTVFYSDDGGEPRVRLAHANGMTRAGALALVRGVIDEDESGFGRIGVYYYDYERVEGGILMACMNHQNGLDATYRLTALTLAISVIALALTYLLVRMVSADMIQPLVENSRRQREFITNASHELKTPLAVIRSNTEMTEVISGETEWTRSTMKQVARLNALVQNLILIARSQEQEQSRKTEDLDISQIVRETAESFTSVAASGGKDYRLDIADNVHLTADSSSIQMLCSVLIDNAIKYCDEQGHVRVSLTAPRRGRALLIVSNSYQAGEKMDFSLFFERFYREDGSHHAESESLGGFGIGLSLAQNITSLYGGRISAGWKNGVISFTCPLNSLRDE